VFVELPFLQLGPVRCHAYIMSVVLQAMERMRTYFKSRLCSSLMQSMTCWNVLFSFMYN
jgi:hypothetical protein